MGTLVMEIHCVKQSVNKHVEVEIITTMALF